MEDDEEKDVLIFDTGCGWNGTTKKQHVMCSNKKTSTRNVWVTSTNMLLAWVYGRYGDSVH